MYGVRGWIPLLPASKGTTPPKAKGTSLLAVKKCGIRAPFVALSLRFVGTPHRSFWMVCSCGHDRIADTLERSRVRSERTSRRASLREYASN